jgi:predicted lipase
MTDNNSEIIKYNDVVDMLSLTFLIYDYGKIIPYVPGDTIEQFVSRVNITEENKIDDEKKQAVKHITENIIDGNIKEFISDEDTDLQAGITISDTKKRITIIFRGSESMYDWYYDMNFIKTRINKKEDVCVHSGFYNQLITNNNDKKITKRVKELLEENPDYHIHVCGHSLGGALCTLYGYMLSNEISQHVTVVSFASPRVGNYGWKKSFKSKSNLTHYRISNNNDIVTAFPSILYYHVGTNIRLEKNASPTLFVNKKYGWWDYSVFKCNSISDHYCSEYYKHLRPW